MNWIVALVVTALLWRPDWHVAFATGIITAVLLGIEGKLCDLQHTLRRIEDLLSHNTPEGLGAWLPASATRDSLLGQKLVTPASVTAIRLNNALAALGRAVDDPERSYKTMRLKESLHQLGNDSK